jgi:hypothetical protein
MSIRLNSSSIRSWIGLRALAVLSALTLLIALSGCKKLLDLRPPNSITRDNFFKSKDDALSTIIGCYDGLQGCAEKFITWGEFRGDMVRATLTTYPYNQNMDKNSSVSDWAPVYTMIARANNVIEFIPRIPQFDEKFSVDDSKKIVAEALFLRALGYFYLVRAFKEVPLVLVAPSNDDVDYFVPKSPADSVLNQIEADLNLAEQNLPATYGTNNAENRGRATLGALHALQTDVYLWRAKYQQAVTASNKVMADVTNYKLVKGSDWFNIFGQKNSTESILEIQWDNANTETNNLGGIVGAYNITDDLTSLYTNLGDVVRGLNSTYITGGSWWKYRGLTATTANLTRPTSDANFILYRLADVMLMQADALAHLGSFEQKTQAISLLDSIHVRAGLFPYALDRGGNLDGNSPTSLLIDLILQERAMEFAVEGKRWFDLVRLATNDKDPEFLISRVVKSRSVGDRTLIRSRIVDPRSWYYPIWQNELLRNPKLVQNPFYR